MKYSNFSVLIANPRIFKYNFGRENSNIPNIPKVSKSSDFFDFCSKLEFMDNKLILDPVCLQFSKGISANKARKVEFFRAH